MQSQIDNMTEGTKTKVVRIPGIEENAPLRCINHCGSIFSSLDELENHLRAVRAGTAPRTPGLRRSVSWLQQRVEESARLQHRVWKNWCDELIAASLVDKDVILSLNSYHAYESLTPDTKHTFEIIAKHMALILSRDTGSLAPILVSTRAKLESKGAGQKWKDDQLFSFSKTMSNLRHLVDGFHRMLEKYSEEKEGKFAREEFAYAAAKLIITLIEVVQREGLTDEEIGASIIKYVYYYQQREALVSSYANNNSIDGQSIHSLVTNEKEI